MKYFKLNLATFPDNLFDKQVPVGKWLAEATETQDKFPRNSLNRVFPIEKSVEIERIFGISLYMVGNVLPFCLPILIVLSLFKDSGKIALGFFLLYFCFLFAVTNFYFKPLFLKKYNRNSTLSETDVADNQYLYTERNTQKYLSLQMVWNESVQRPTLESQPVIFAALPHGAAPLGITAYPLWSKLFNDNVCHWTCAPIVLKLPIIEKYMRLIGYIPAKTKDILNVLTKKEGNVGIILDGIAGMFHSHDEIAHIRARKGIVKIALRAGVPIIPVYAFGHTSLWKVIVDPFGILKMLSVKLEIALTPFFGRWFWFIGPPARIGVAVCLGEPVTCPRIEEPSQAEIDKYHQQLLDHYNDLFETHKDAYGWSEKKLKFV